MTSGAVAAMSFGFFLAAAVPIFAAISNARPGLLSVFLPTFFAAEPICLKKSPDPYPFIVLTDTIKDLFLIQVKQVPFNSLVIVFLRFVISP